MSGKDLFEGMSYVDERFVDEAENMPLPKPIVSPWIKVASMAACLCLIIFSLYNLQPYPNRVETEGAAGQVAEDAMPEGGLVSEDIDQPGETCSEVIIENCELPSVMLYVEKMTEDGFIGTVAELTDAYYFEIGMELNVVLDTGTLRVDAEGKVDTYAENKTDYSGSSVIVQFIEYNKKTGTLVINMIYEVPLDEITP